MSNRKPTPGTMEWYAAQFDEDVRRADLRLVRLADRRRAPRMSHVLPKTTRRPRSQ